MIRLEDLLKQAERYETEIKDFRLTGDLRFLVDFVNAALDAKESVLMNDFLNALTTSESSAFEAIRQEIGLSGNISVVKMIQKTNLSRPVWTSLLQKMEKFNIAIVKSQGVKGTYIEFKEEK